MRTLLLELTGVAWFLMILRIMQGSTEISDDDEYTDTVFWITAPFFNFVTEVFVLPIVHFCIATIYSIYLKLTLVNVIIFFVKYVPTGLYAYRFMKDVYLPSRERILQKHSEIEDIQLQIQIVNTKLSVRETERAEQQRRGVERLRRVRARVRDLIDADDALKQTFYADTNFGLPDIHVETCSEETERETIMKLLKELKYDQSVDMSEKSSVKLGHDTHADEQTTSENSFYSTPSDVDPVQECHVKIVKVTNVYKVAYLKQYIKLKRLRRASKQALLKKKMEGVKKLLEDWQDKLNMVINSQMTILNCNGHPVDVVSHEAMGDYSTARGSDSDSDMQNSYLDSSYEDYRLSWGQNPYPSYYEDSPNQTVSKDYDGLQEYNDFKYTGTGNMLAIVEETNSQIDCEENQANGGECKYSDLIVL